jgi:hypothetical protein
MIKELQDHVGREIGPIAKPKDLRFGENLPKTRSGKIMRRLLRSLAKGETVCAGCLDARKPGDSGATAGLIDAPAALVRVLHGAAASFRVSLTGHGRRP